ncbi:MAG: hypothetical protein ACI3V5_11115 [Faecousia sp.]
MAGVRYLSILPAEDPVHRSKGLNLLLMVDNPGEDTVATVRFYGSDGSAWREIFSQEQRFRGHSHIHAYFHLPASCFAPENWNGEALEELSLWAGEAPPAPTEPGRLLFLEP